MGRDIEKQREYNKTYREEHREEIAAQKRRWREENHEYVLERRSKWRETRREEIREYARQYNVENREAVSARNLRYNHGLTTAEYERVLAGQSSCCAICGRTAAEAMPSGKNLHVDHDHTCCPGKRSCGKCVRGLVCGPCNTALGLLQDDPDVLLSAAAYLLTAGKRIVPDWTAQWED